MRQRVCVLRRWFEGMKAYPGGDNRDNADIIAGHFLDDFLVGSDADKDCRAAFCGIWRFEEEANGKNRPSDKRHDVPRMIVSCVCYQRRCFQEERIYGSCETKCVRWKSCGWYSYFHCAVLNPRLATGGFHGGVSEWLKEHAWKACVRYKRTVGSNPTPSAIVSNSNHGISRQNLLESHLLFGGYVKRIESRKPSYQDILIAECQVQDETRRAFAKCFIKFEETINVFFELLYFEKKSSVDESSLGYAFYCYAKDICIALPCSLTAGTAESDMSCSRVK